MRAPLLALLTVALVACGRHEPNPAAVAEVTAFEAEFDRMRRELPEVQAKVPDQQDFRGRTPHDDISQWVFSTGTQRKIDAVKERAFAAASTEEAKTILQDARELAQADVLKARAISTYWNSHLPAPYWRHYWAALFDANGLPAEEPDPLLVETEKRIGELLEKGDFAAAGSEADALAEMLPTSLSMASNRILKDRKSAVQFSPRRSGCVQGAAPEPRSRNPKIIRTAELESFYPAEALSRGETGAVILRARVDRAGCGTHVAIVVRSGVASLDSAALNWFETAQFAPATPGGQPAESELTFKVKFELRDRG